MFKSNDHEVNNSSQKNEIENLCIQLEKEHVLMNDYFQQMELGNYFALGEFGTLLKAHTRTEERQLFPSLETYFSPTELDFIHQTSLKYRV